MRSIEGYEGLYAVTEDGRVWSYKSKKFLSPRKAGAGYLQVALYKEGELRSEYIHRLVAQAYIPNPDHLPEVNHINEDKLNNHFSNLEWVTHQDNLVYGTRLQRAAEKLSTRVYCVELARVFNSMNEAARELNLGAGNICIACKNSHRTAGGYHWEYVEEA